MGLLCEVWAGDPHNMHSLIKLIRVATDVDKMMALDLLMYYLVRF